MRRLNYALGSAVIFFSTAVPAFAQSTGFAPLTVATAPQVGAYAVHVSGTGPASSQILLRLSAKISSDLPTVSLEDAMTSTDAGGNYSTTIPLAGAYWYGLVLNVDADAPDSGEHAVATFITRPSNEKFKTKIDVVPSQ